MGRRKLAEDILDRLASVIPAPTTELSHEDPYELLVAVILSAQCTDARVNEATPALFRAYPDVNALASATPEDVLVHIRSISFPNNKARYLVGMARRVRDVFGGRIPEGLTDLQSLPGAGRKTAQVVAGVAFGADALPVDTHVFRVAHRLGLVLPADAQPEAVERRLSRILPEGRLSEAHHLFILHGRYTCTARGPACGGCAAADRCAYLAALNRLPGPLDGLEPSRGRYYCHTRGHHVDDVTFRTDRAGIMQPRCPRCGSSNLFLARTGRSIRRIRDPRVGDPNHGSPDHRT